MEGPRRRRVKIKKSGIPPLALSQGCIFLDLYGFSARKFLLFFILLLLFNTQI
jgi:hypothetical protein